MYYLYTTPRSGSTWVMEILSGWLEENCGYKEQLYEFFLNYPPMKPPSRYYAENGEIKRTIVSNYNWEDELLNRIELLKKFPNHLVKVFSHDIKNRELKEFLKSRKMISLERKDKSAQLISFAIMLHVSNNLFFNTETEMQNFFKSLLKFKLDRKIFIGFTEFIDLFNTNKDKAEINLIYEEISKEYLEKKGFGFPKRIKRPSVKNIQKNLSIFINKEEVEKWIKERPDIFERSK